MDFGLSKVVGSKEKTNEGFGSLCYSSPEIITRQPYNNKVDVWSIGVIIYYLSSGTFPFDDANDDVQKIAKKIINEDVAFPDKGFSKLSSGLKEMIAGCLCKNLKCRFDINELVNNNWFDV